MPTITSNLVTIRVSVIAESRQQLLDLGYPENQIIHFQPRADLNLAESWSVTRFFQPGDYESFRRQQFEDAQFWSWAALLHDLRVDIDEIAYTCHVEQIGFEAVDQSDDATRPCPDCGRVMELPYRSPVSNEFQPCDECCVRRR